MKKSEATRQWIIEKTAPLFNRKGYDGTSMADLTHVTGMTKGALYGNFLDKEEIAEEAFKYAIRKVREVAGSHLSKYSTFKDKLQALLDFYSAYVFNPPIDGGCPLLNHAIEADDHRTYTRKMVSIELLHTVEFIEGLLRQGVEAGEFKEDINPRELAYTFFCSVEGALMFSRVERSNEPMEIIVQHCKNILDRISNR